MAYKIKGEHATLDELLKSSNSLWDFIEGNKPPTIKEEKKELVKVVTETGTPCIINDLAGLLGNSMKVNSSLIDSGGEFKVEAQPSLIPDCECDAHKEALKGLINVVNTTKLTHKSSSGVYKMNDFSKPETIVKDKDLPFDGVKDKLQEIYLNDFLFKKDPKKKKKSTKKHEKTNIQNSKGRNRTKTKNRI
jgi:hypothetical protein